jgi:small GTP-binding protein
MLSGVPPRFKVIFLGNVNVGKTSIIKRKIQGTFDIRVEPNVGVDHQFLECNVDSETIELFVWDTAGDERFQAIVPNYARQACVACVVCSILDEQSIRSLTERWLPFIQNLSDAPIAIAVVNKIDIKQGYFHTIEEVHQFLGEPFKWVRHTSAKTGEGIDDLFDLIAATAAGSARTSLPVFPDSPDVPRSGCC